ncbi:MAG: response regulator transcription factor [Myxococcales bacterium]|jgi:PleD family two-component response regulator
MEKYASLSSDPNATEERPRILVVDPSKRNLAVIARRLWEAGFRVATAERAEHAIAELHLAHVDLMLAELDMPATDGAELTRLVRDETMWRDLPIMLITGRFEPTGVVRAYEAGADDVVVKPFHFEVLFARIERRLSRARSLQQLRDDNATLDARVVERAIQLGELREQLANAGR